MSFVPLPAPTYNGLQLRTAVNATLVEVQAARRFTTAALLLADTTLAYGTGDRPVAAGDIIEAGGFRYEVAASGASDHALTTAGGVKLYVRQNFGRPLAYGISRTPTVARCTAMVLIPTDFATLQAAVNALGPSPADIIELRIVAGHRPTTGLALTEGDYSRYVITSATQATAFLGLTGTVAVVVGETLTQATSGATGVVVSQGGVGDRIVLLSGVTGTFNTANTLTGSSSGALGASSVPAYVKAGPVLCPTFTGDFVTADDADMPQLACLVASSGEATGIASGYEANGRSTGSVVSGCGVVGCWSDGLRAYRGASVTANGAVFSWNAQNNATSSNAVSWGAVLNAENADLTFSGYYGGQAAHAGVANYKGANADDADRYGFRGSDLGAINVDGATANRAGLYGFYSFNGSTMSGDACTALNCGTYGAAATGAGILNLGAASLSGGTAGIYVAEGSQATVGLGNAGGDVVRGAIAATGGVIFAGSSSLRRTDAVDATNDIVVQDGGTIVIGATTLGGLSQGANQWTPEGLILNGGVSAVANPALNSNQDNWDPGLSTSSIFAAVPSADREVTGILAPSLAGRDITIWNNSAFAIRFVHDSGSSTAANRFAFPTAANYMLHAGQSVRFVYASDRWRLAGVSHSQLPTYVKASLPPAAPAGQMIYVSDEAGGAVPAFSDGSDWRRVTDRAVVS